MLKIPKFIFKLRKLDTQSNFNHLLPEKFWIWAHYCKILLILLRFYVKIDHFLATADCEDMWKEFFWKMKNSQEICKNLIFLKSLLFNPILYGWFEYVILYGGGLFCPSFLFSSYIHHFYSFLGFKCFFR